MSAASPLEPAWVRRRLHVPREHGDVLAIPALSDMPAVIASNCEAIAKWPVDCLGKPLSELRRLAREEALNAARQYTAWLDAAIAVHGIDRTDGRLEKPIPETAGQPLILSGHQPELAHPGVWAKNFVLDGLATATGGTCCTRRPSPSQSARASVRPSNTFR